MRIVSLLPSATEILFAVGAGDQVCGVTFECDYPEEARRRTIVSSTELPVGLTPAQIDTEVRSRLADGEDLYTLDEGAFRELDPDLVVTQDLCGVCAVDSTEVDVALAHLGCRAEVLTLDPATLDQVLESIGAVGRRPTAGGPRTGWWPTSVAGSVPWPVPWLIGPGAGWPCWSGPTRPSPRATGCPTW